MLIASAVIALLILVNALYVAAEFATVSVRRSQIAALAEDGHRLAKRLLPRVETPMALDHYIAACQIGITWSSLVVGAYSQAALAVPYSYLLEQWLQVDSLTAFSWMSIAVLLVMTTLQMVLGELAPKSIALQFPTQIALATVVPMEISLRLYAWFLAFLNGSGFAILRLFGVNPVSHQHIHSPGEIEFLLSESNKTGLLESEEHRRLRRALHLAARPVRDLMIPRRLMIMVSVDASPEEILEILKSTNFTRLPVYEESPENIIGTLHSKDYVSAYAQAAAPPSLRSVMRPITTVLESATAGQLLQSLRDNRTHQVIVVGESGVRGLVAFGDLLAELLGGIAGKGHLGQPAPERLTDGRVRLPALMRTEDAAEWIGIHWDIKSATVGGLIIGHVGHIPKKGEIITLLGVEFEIEKVGRQSISSVLARSVAARRNPKL